MKILLNKIVYNFIYNNLMICKIKYNIYIILYFYFNKKYINSNLKMIWMIYRILLIILNLIINNNFIICNIIWKMVFWIYLKFWKITHIENNQLKIIINTK